MYGLGLLETLSAWQRQCFQHVLRPRVYLPVHPPAVTDGHLIDMVSLRIVCNGAQDWLPKSRSRRMRRTPLHPLGSSALSMKAAIERPAGCRRVPTAAELFTIRTFSPALMQASSVALEAEHAKRQAHDRSKNLPS